MIYARAADVNVYIKRNFAPLEDRVRSIVAIESQVPNIIIAAKTNLDPVLPKPYVELAIQIAQRLGGFSAEESGRSDRRSEGRTASRRIFGIESKSRRAL